MTNSPEINLTDEIRRAYDHELNRMSNLDSKASTLFGLGAIVITIQGFIIDNLISQNASFLEKVIIAIFGLLAVSLLISSLYYLIRVINIINYANPYEKNPNKIHKKLSYENFKNDYGISIFQTRIKNDAKAKKLMKGRILLFMGIIISVIPLLLLSVLRLEYYLLIVLILAPILYVIYKISFNRLKLKPYDYEKEQKRGEKLKNENMDKFLEKCGECLERELKDNGKEENIKKFKDGEHIFLCPKCKKWICLNCLETYHKNCEEFWFHFIIKNGLPESPE
jgi:ABC-type multidrug transport system fused ATPase/permease subunit